MIDEARLTAIEELALRYHKEVEGEYGCGYPQTKCPGVLRLIKLLEEGSASHARAVEGRPCACCGNTIEPPELCERCLRDGVPDPTNPVVAARPHEQEQPYPWDKIRAECWSQVTTIFREEGRDGAMACFYRSAAVDNARKLDEEQIDALRAALSAKDQQIASLQQHIEEKQKELDEQNCTTHAQNLAAKVRKLEAALTELLAQLEDARKEALISRNDKRIAEADLAALRARLALPPQAQEPVK